MKLNELKSELKEKGKEIERYCEEISQKIERKEGTITMHLIGDCFSFIKAYKQKSGKVLEITGQFFDVTPEVNNLMKQAEIFALKKGISACEELEKEAGVLKHWITCQDLMINDMEKELKQALSQRNQEILEILNKYKNTFCDLCEEDYQKLKKQLTNSEGKK